MNVDLVAQLVEHNTFNVGAQGSNPCGITQALRYNRGAFFMPYTYILFSEKLNKYYVGACIDLERRLYEHNIGHSKFTSLGLPWKIVYTEEFDTLAEAKKREKQIKNMKSRKYIEMLISKGSASRF
jgi:putative endonuclease